LAQFNRKSILYNLSQKLKQQTVSRFSLRSVYIKCSKWCPFIWTHATSRFLHSSMPSSMMAWLKCDHTSTRLGCHGKWCSWYSAAL